MNPYWTNASANEKLAEISALPREQKAPIIEQIRSNLKNFVLEHFSLNALQQECRETLPNEYYEETGFLMAHALEKGYEIQITVDDEPTPMAARKRGDRVEAGWSQKKGWHAVYIFEF
jgi:hypothetical protein